MLDAIFQVIDENREVYIRELQVLCRQPSIGVSGEGMTQTADMVEQIVRKTEARTEQIVGDDEANALVTRKYSDHWGRPNGV